MSHAYPDYDGNMVPKSCCSLRMEFEVERDIDGMCKEKGKKVNGPCIIEIEQIMETVRTGPGRAGIIKKIILVFLILILKKTISLPNSFGISGHFDCLGDCQEVEKFKIDQGAIKVTMKHDIFFFYPWKMLAVTSYKITSDIYVFYQKFLGIRTLLSIKHINFFINKAKSIFL